jgi:hypothetical protein
MCRRLPWHLASGRAGWVITTLFAIADALAINAYFRQGLRASASIALITSVIAAVVTALLVGGRRRYGSVVTLASAFGLATGLLPVAVGIAADIGGVDEIGGTAVGRLVAIWTACVVSTLASGAMFGVMLATIARLSLNLSQPFAALGEPGFKHFLRMRVDEPDHGPATIEVFVIGAVDPVGASAPVLVDHFRWEARSESEENEGGKDGRGGTRHKPHRPHSGG